MAYSIRSFHVSHGGIPAGLNSLDDWQDYIVDLNRELHALRDSWRVYCAQSSPSEADANLYQSAEDRLEGLKHEAVERMRAWEGSRPAPLSGKRRR